MNSNTKTRALYNENINVSSHTSSIKGGGDVMIKPSFAASSKHTTASAVRSSSSSSSSKLVVIKPVPVQRQKQVFKRARDQIIKDDPPIFSQAIDGTLHANKSRKVGSTGAAGDQVSPGHRRIQLVYQAQLNLNTDPALAFVALKDGGTLHYVKDVDFDDCDDPAMCAQYAHEIMDYLMVRERVFMPNQDYIRIHSTLDWQVRAVVVDWLAEVQKRRDFLPETLYLGVNLMDRFLSRKTCDSNEIQKVGLACLFIAAKLEETEPVTIGMLSSYLNNSEEESALLNAEKFVLETLDFEIWAPGPYSFIRRMSKADEFDYMNRTLAKFLTEYALLDHRMLVYPPSQVAAGCYYFAQWINQTKVYNTTIRIMHQQTTTDDDDATTWTPFLVYASGYDVNDLIPIVCLLADFVSKHFSTLDSAFHYFTAKLTRTEYAVGLAARMMFLVKHLNLERTQASLVRACFVHDRKVELADDVVEIIGGDADDAENRVAYSKSAGGKKPAEIVAAAKKDSSKSSVPSMA